MSSSNDGSVLQKIAELSELALGTYAFNPDRVEEDANGERRIHQGGYGDRQIYELVQNAADELRDPSVTGGRIHVVLAKEHLYCANEGNPITPDGADTILRMGVSKKRGQCQLVEAIGSASSFVNTSRGVRKPSTARGRSLSSSAIVSR